MPRPVSEVGWFWIYGLAALVHTVLGLPQNHLAAHENFFHLGGDSILIMTICTITAADVFSQSTLTGLGGNLDL